MPPMKQSPGAEDWTRFTTYLIGASWALLFSVLTPASYVGVVSQTIVHVWSGFVGIGMLLAAFGAATRRDTQLELSGIYLALVGALLYLVAQLGFIGTSSLLDRLPFSLFILWHLSQMTPRLVGLELYRRRVRAARLATRTES